MRQKINFVGLSVVLVPLWIALSVLLVFQGRMLVAIYSLAALVLVVAAARCIWRVKPWFYAKGWLLDVIFLLLIAVGLIFLAPITEAFPTG